MKVFSRAILAALVAVMIGGTIALASGGGAVPSPSSTAVDVKGPCDEAEHANDARCDGIQIPEDRNSVQPGGDDDDSGQTLETETGDDSGHSGEMEVGDDSGRSGEMEADDDSHRSGETEAGDDSGHSNEMELDHDSGHSGSDNSGPGSDDSGHSSFGSGHSGSDDSGRDHPEDD